MPDVCRRDSDHHNGWRITLSESHAKHRETPGWIVELFGYVELVLARASSPSAVLLRDTPWRVEEKNR